MSSLTRGKKTNKLVFVFWEEKKKQHTKLMMWSGLPWDQGKFQLLLEYKISAVDQKSDGCFSSHFDWRRGSKCHLFHGVSFHWMIKKLGEVGELICTHSGKLYILWSKWITSSLFRPFTVKWKSKVFPYVPYAQNAMLVWLWSTLNIYSVYTFQNFIGEMLLK